MTDQELQDLKTFYATSTLRGLVEQQALHIVRLQEKFHDMNRRETAMKASMVPRSGLPRA